MSDLQVYGWSSEWEAQVDVTPAHEVARVTAEHRNSYRIQTAAGERSAKVAGRMRHRAQSGDDLPAVGDWVEVVPGGEDDDWIIRHVFPRRSKFSRKAAGERTEEQVVAANVDYVWIVTSIDQDFSPRRLERYLSLAWESGATPVVVLTKADLTSDIDQFVEQAEEVSIGISVHPTSCLTEFGLEPLKQYLADHSTVALLGSSGVGKSTLINSLAGNVLQETGDTRSDGKGRHTTTYRQLIRLPQGGLIIDTPGMRELQLWDGEAGVQDTFGDIEEIAATCRFGDCQHAGEPGCSVTRALDDGAITLERLESYRKLQRELAHLDRKKDSLAMKEETRRFKVIMKSMKAHHPKYNRDSND